MSGEYRRFLHKRGSPSSLSRASTPRAFPGLSCFLHSRDLPLSSLNLQAFQVCTHFISGRAEVMTRTIYVDLPRKGKKEKKVKFEKYRRTFLVKLGISNLSLSLSI